VPLDKSAVAEGIDDSTTLMARKNKVPRYGSIGINVTQNTSSWLRCCKNSS